METPPTLPTITSHILSALLASAASTTLTHPLENAVVRSRVLRILRRNNPNHQDDDDYEVEDEEIARLLGAGEVVSSASSSVLPSTGTTTDVVWKRGMEAAAFWGMYAALRGGLVASVRGRTKTSSVSPSSSLGVLEAVALGLLAGMAGRVVAVSTSNILTRVDHHNSRSSKKRRSRKESSTFSNVLAALSREKPALLSGYLDAGGLVRGILEPGLTVALEQILRGTIPALRRRGGMEEVVGLAVIAKAVVTVGTFPMRVVLARQVAGDIDIGGERGGRDMGSGEKGSEEDGGAAIGGLDNQDDVASKESRTCPPKIPQKHQGTMFDAARSIYRQEGLGGLFDGLGMDVLRAMLQLVIFVVGKGLAYQLILRLALAVFRVWNKRAAKMVTSADGTVGMMGRHVRLADTEGRRIEATTTQRQGEATTEYRHRVHHVPLRPTARERAPNTTQPPRYRLGNNQPESHLPLHIHEPRRDTRVAGTPSTERWLEDQASRVAGLMKEWPWNLQNSHGPKVQPAAQTQQSQTQQQTPTWRQFWASLPWKKIAEGIEFIDGGDTGSLVANLVDKCHRKVA